MTWLLLGIILLFDVAIGDPETSKGDALSIRLNQSPGSANFGSVEIRGLEKAALEKLKQAGLNARQWRAFFAMYVGESLPKPTDDILPMLGKYQIEANLIRFTPRFPLVGGLTYYAHFARKKLADFVNISSETSKNQQAISALFTIPNTLTAPTYVEKVYPSGDKLPENQLKLYIYFSAPMRRGNVYHYFTLRNAAGEKIAAPFIEVEQEGWDPHSRRLTLFFNPGRIKRGLRPYQDMGLALKAGEQYQLEINQEMKDAMGNPLKAAFRKMFSAMPEDRISPTPGSWQKILPIPGTTEPLRLIFPEPLDYALLKRVISVFDHSGKRIEGEVKIGKTETEWAFFPSQPWQSGTYSIRIAAILEDLAGNNLNRLFDMEISSKDREPGRFGQFANIYFTLTKK